MEPLKGETVEKGARLNGTFGSYYPHGSLHHFHASCRKITESSDNQCSVQCKLYFTFIQMTLQHLSQIALYFLVVSKSI